MRENIDKKRQMAGLCSTIRDWININNKPKSIYPRPVLVFFKRRNDTLKRKPKQGFRVDFLSWNTRTMYETMRTTQVASEMKQYNIFLLDRIRRDGSS